MADTMSKHNVDPRRKQNTPAEQYRKILQNNFAVFHGPSKSLVRRCANVVAGVFRDNY